MQRLWATAAVSKLLLLTYLSIIYYKFYHSIVSNSLSLPHFLVENCRFHYKIAVVRNTKCVWSSKKCLLCLVKCFPDTIYHTISTALCSLDHLCDWKSFRLTSRKSRRMGETKVQLTRAKFEFLGRYYLHHNNHIQRHLSLLCPIRGNTVGLKYFFTKFSWRLQQI